MTLSLSQLQALKTAILGDANLASARAAGDQGAMVAYYNGPGAGFVWRPNISIAELMTGVVWSEYIALSQGQRDAFRCLISGTTVDSTSSNIRSGFSSIFAGTTITNLTAIGQKTPPTRLEALFATSNVTSLFGYQVSVADIAAALGS